MIKLEKIKSNNDLLRLLRKPVVKGLMAFTMPVCILLFIYHGLGIYPYKQMTVLTSDLQNRYISYYAYIREMFANGNGLFYTFSKALGGDMLGFAGYYLLSPFNLILFLYPLNEITRAVYVMTILKIGMAGLSFYILCAVKNKPDYRYLLFSTAYAMMSYCFTFQFHLMWLDAVIFLPLVILGVHRILEKKAPYLYILFLGITIITNYYTGYMVCLFVVIYTIYRMIAGEITGERFREKLLILAKLAGATIIGVGLSCIVLVPGIMTLVHAGDASFSISFVLHKNFNLLELLPKFFSGSFDSDQIVSGMPNIFCGIFILFMVFLFFANKRIHIRKKIGAGFLLLIILGSFYIREFNMVWHGFSLPDEFYYRHSFLLSFGMIYFAAEAFDEKESSFSFLNLFTAVWLVIGMAVFAIYIKPDYLDIRYLFIDVAIAVAYAFLLYRYAHGNQKLAPVLLFVVTGIHFFNLYLGDAYILSHHSYLDLSLNSYINELTPMMDAMKERDKEFYRMEKDFFFSYNDPMLFSYKGLSHDSSTEQDSVKEFLESMGYVNGEGLCYDKGSTLAADSLLGIKYILSREDAYRGLEKYDMKNGVRAFSNPYSLSLGFLGSRAIYGIKKGAQNSFQFQNDIYRRLTGNTEDIFKEAAVSFKTMENVTEYYENGTYYYEKEDKEDEASITFTFIAESDNPIYGFLDSENKKKAKLYINDLNYETFHAYHQGIFYMDKAQPGETITLKIELLEDSLIFGEPQFYYQDMEVLKRQTEQLQESALYLYEAESSYIHGEIVSKEPEEVLILSIPYDENWDIYVDNKKVEARPIMGCLTAVDIEEGNHQIILRYVPGGFRTGIIISIISLAILLLCIIISVVQKRFLE